MEPRQQQFTRRLRCEAEFGGIRFALTSLSKHFLRAPSAFPKPCRNVFNRSPPTRPQQPCCSRLEFALDAKCTRRKLFVIIGSKETGNGIGLVKMSGRRKRAWEG
jgi:hypothetical protein